MNPESLALLEKLADEIQREWRMGGLFEGIYRDFFIELFARYERVKGADENEN